uniref:glucuronosyltransferase n=1 Tax=Meloidogyne hapla TaxID=6305 RepID=A0A1I8BA69_MELHA
MGGSFAVFDALGIKNTFDASASVFKPSYLQFLNFTGSPINFKKLHIPEFKTAKPGDWKIGAEIWIKGTERYNENQRNHVKANNLLAHDLRSTCNIFYNELFEEMKNEKFYVKKKPPRFDILFQNIRLHFFNQHPLGIFKTFPKHDKIVYIGGTHVEENKELNIKVKKVDDEHQCVVLVSFGTVLFSGGLEDEDIEIMLNEFKEYKNCLFKVRIEEHRLPFNYESISNLEVYETENLPDGMLPQKQILFTQSTKLFISHCGQHSLTEAMYAGVPLICIPNADDQLYNASIVEHLGIGIYVSLAFIDEDGNRKTNENFENDFSLALGELLSNNFDYYQKKSYELRNEILNYPPTTNNILKNNWMKEVFLEEIKKVIGE